MSPRAWLTPGVCFVAIAALACTAEIAGKPGQNAGTGGSLGGGGQGAAGGSTMPQTACDATLGLAPPRVWRLSDQQYASGGHDVFGGGRPGAPRVRPPPGPGPGGGNNAPRREDWG